jgi:hypothetical protein
MSLRQEPGTGLKARDLLRARFVDEGLQGSV